MVLFLYTGHSIYHSQLHNNIIKYNEVQVPDSCIYHYIQIKAMSVLSKVKHYPYLSIFTRKGALQLCQWEDKICLQEVREALVGGALIIKKLCLAHWVELNDCYMNLQLCNPTCQRRALSLISDGGHLIFQQELVQLLEIMSMCPNLPVLPEHICQLILSCYVWQSRTQLGLLQLAYYSENIC